MKVNPSQLAAYEILSLLQTLKLTQIKNNELFTKEMKRNSIKLNVNTIFHENTEEKQAKITALHILLSKCV